MAPRGAPFLLLLEIQVNHDFLGNDRCEDVAAARGTVRRTMRPQRDLSSVGHPVVVGV